MILMKNNQVITSWNKIEPSDSANERMLSAILEQNRSVHNRKDKVNSMSQKKTKKRFLVPVAVCLVALVAVTGIIGASVGWFGSKEYTVGLANGDSIVYHSGSSAEANFGDVGFPTSSRELSNEELDILFPKTSEPRRGMGIFREETGELLRLEGEIGDAKVIFASDGFPVNDVLIEGNETSSSVDGIPVTTGYFITDANSKGNQTAVFFGTFTLGRTNIYVECAGDKNEADNVSRVTANLILSIIENGEPDLNVITK